MELFALLAGVALVGGVRKSVKQRKLEKLNRALAEERMARIKGMTSGKEWVDVEQFLADKESGAMRDFVGVYIIWNRTQDIYYVGQGTKTLQRCSNHFNGKGNGDIYADHKYGHIMSVKFIKLSESGYENLDDLERDNIEAYGGYEAGYNKTRGNK